MQVRRRALETERQTRIQEMAERRRQRASEFELRQQEKEKERVEAARAKDRDREERLAALSKQQKAHIEELQKKIQLKVTYAWSKLSFVLQHCVQGKSNPCIHCHNSDKQCQILTEFWINNAMSNSKQITKFK